MKPTEEQINEKMMEAIGCHKSAVLGVNLWRRSDDYSAIRTLNFCAGHTFLYLVYKALEAAHKHETFACLLPVYDEDEDDSPAVAWRVLRLEPRIIVCVALDALDAWPTEWEKDWYAQTEDDE